MYKFLAVAMLLISSVQAISILLLPSLGTPGHYMSVIGGIGIAIFFAIMYGIDEITKVIKESKK